MVTGHLSLSVSTELGVEISVAKVTATKQGKILSLSSLLHDHKLIVALYSINIVSITHSSLCAAVTMVTKDECIADSP